VYRVEDPGAIDLRRQLGRGREVNIFVTGAASLVLGDYAVFDGDLVDTVIITTKLGAARLAEKKSHPHVRIVVSGECDLVDLVHAASVLRTDFGIRHLLCEGGPTLYGWMDRAGLIDEKFLTISPVEVGQGIPPEQEPSDSEKANPPKFRPTVFGAPGFTKEQALWWDWISCRKIDDHQFSRYRRRRNGESTAA
jgi:riboflavin biosynthesis pyrimidine reductase